MRVKPIDVPNDYKLFHCNIQNVVKYGTNSGIYRLTNEKSTQMSLEDYRALAMEKTNDYRQYLLNETGRHSEFLSITEIDEVFWKYVETRSDTSDPAPIYAIDNEMSRFPQDWNWWNLNALSPQISCLSSESVKIPGINSPFVYYGMPWTAFALHHEDSNVESINIHHGGAIKVWYSIPSSNAAKLEQV